MTQETVYLMEIRLLGKSNTSFVYYTGPTAHSPPAPKIGEQVNCGGVTGKVTSVIHERENFPGYFIFYLDIFIDMSEDSDETAFNRRLQGSGQQPRLKDLLRSLVTGLGLFRPT